jgi:hypothetical protein
VVSVVEIKKVELNNTSRKGKFYYVKEKGVRGGYYDCKLHTEEGAKALYEQQYILTPKNKKKAEEQKERVNKLIAKKPYKKDTIKKGSITLSLNPNTITSGKIQAIYKEIQTKLGNEQTTLSNIKNNKHRFVYDVCVYGKEGEKLGTFQDVGNKNIEEFVQAYLVNTTLLEQGAMVGYNWNNRISKKGLLPPNSVHRIQQGQIQSVTVDITYDAR